MRVFDVQSLATLYADGNPAPDEQELTQPEQGWPDLGAASHLSLRVDLFSVSNAEIVFETSDSPDGEWQTVIEQSDFPGAGSTVVVALSREISRAQRTQRLMRWLRWRVRFSAAGSYISFRASGVSR